MAWDEEKKQKAQDLYCAMKPTPETSMDCVKEVAEKLGETANGVRMILSKAEVYVKKDPTVKAAGTDESGTKAKGTRVSKEGAIASLTKAIEDAGQEADEEVLSKLTGKAAVYFTTLINKLAK